jgi:hypothetical protein
MVHLNQKHIDEVDAKGGQTRGIYKLLGISTALIVIAMSVVFITYLF